MDEVELERRLTKLEINAERDRKALDLATHGTEQRSVATRSTIASVLAALAMVLSVWAAFLHH